MGVSEMYNNNDKKYNGFPLLQGAHAGIIRSYNVLFSFLHL